MSLKLNELKRELEELPNPQVIQLCVRLAKLKVENKELLHYLLFYADDSIAYAELLKPEILDAFDQPFVNAYTLGKRLRKSMRIIAKYIRFSGNRAGESELLLALVEAYLSNYRYEYRNAALARIVVRCLKKTRDNIAKLHEDIQADYSGLYDEALKKVQLKLSYEYTSELKSWDA
jgi:hypothetical protein